MRSSYQITASQNLIQATFEGKITSHGLIEHMNRVNADRDFRKGMDTIADFSASIVDWDYWDLNHFRAYTTYLSTVRGTCKWAVIVTGGITVSSARLFIIMHEVWNPVIEIRMFSNEADAMTWIMSSR